jgi:undecaprenyl-diphosphatase
MSILAYVQHSDLQMSVRLCRWGGPRWFRRMMLIITRLGDGWLWLVGLAVLSWAMQPQAALRELALAAAITNLTLILMKRTCRRSRPAELGLAIGSPRFAPELLAFDRFSFPSGHSLNAFAATTVLAAHFPLATPLLAPLAVSIAISRVFLGRHFLGDIVAGAMIGMTIGLVVVTKIS